MRRPGCPYPGQLQQRFNPGVRVHGFPQRVPQFPEYLAAAGAVAAVQVAGGHGQVAGATAVNPVPAVCRAQNSLPALRMPELRMQPQVHGVQRGAGIKAGLLAAIIVDMAASPSAVYSRSHRGADVVIDAKQHAADTALRLVLWLSEIPR